jgi:hypothetical protein
LLPSVVTLVLLLALAALFGFLADRYGDGATVLDVAWRLDELQRRFDWGERASEVDPGATRAAVAAIVGGTVATASVLLVPFLPVPVAGGLTLPAAVDVLDEYVPAVDVLWLLPVGTALIAFNGFRLWSGADRGARWGRRTSAGLAASCAVVLVLLLGVYFLPSVAASWVATGLRVPASVGFGYGLCLLGVVGSLVGSRVVAGRLRTSSTS